MSKHNKASSVLLRGENKANSSQPVSTGSLDAAVSLRKLEGSQCYRVRVPVSYEYGMI